jgi:hypothetical protein
VLIVRASTAPSLTQSCRGAILPLRDAQNPKPFETLRVKIFPAFEAPKSISAMISETIGDVKRPPAGELYRSSEYGSRAVAEDGGESLGEGKWKEMW